MAPSASSQQQPAEEEADFFQNSPAPSSLPATRSAAAAFIDAQVQANRRVALVTSGGTMVPLEQQTVRFIDNFSAGTRGAASAEYFLDEGYSVIFFHRKFSLQPYSRHYSHSTNCFLDFLMEDGADDSSDATRNGIIKVRDEYQSSIRTVLRKWSAVKRENRLLMLPFVTVSEYLWTLRELSSLLKPVGSGALLYLAAAVSDFFIPNGRLSEHKIQSTEPKSDMAKDGTDGTHTQPPQGQKLMVDLDPVPKFLKRLVHGWASDAMIVSFKLETDQNLLLSKAQQALERYSHQLVIGNLLSTRTWEVLFVEPGEKERWLRIPASQLVKGLLGGNSKSSDHQEAAKPEIESLIVPEVVKLHQKHVASHSESLV
jgi:phosphopantothenate---cysteine ligase (ATP)